MIMDLAQPKGDVMDLAQPQVDIMIMDPAKPPEADIMDPTQPPEVDDFEELFKEMEEEMNEVQEEHEAWQKALQQVVRRGNVSRRQAGISLIQICVLFVRSNIFNTICMREQKRGSSPPRRGRKW